MYDLPYHKEDNEQAIKDFIARYPFALLTGCNTENEPVATQIPVFLEEKNGRQVLRGHFMRNTDHHKAFIRNQNALVVLTGPHIYVSGTWYSNPHTPSTWNYMSVHIRGIIRLLNDAELIDVLRITSSHFENHDPESTTIYDNIPPEKTKQLMKAAVAFEIEIKKMDAVFKLSQDRDETSYNNIIAQLKQQGESGQIIADEMAKRTKKVFSASK